MAEVLISGRVRFGVLEQIELLGERSGRKVLCWWRSELCFAGGKTENFRLNFKMKGRSVNSGVHGNALI